jgi:hypothetical protein
VDDVRARDGALGLQDSGAFIAAPAAMRGRVDPQPLPLEERVFPPRRLDVGAPSVQDSVPTARAGCARGRWARPVRPWSSRRRSPRRKNVVLAGALGLFLGPIGMLYASVQAAIAAVLVGSVVFTLTLVLGLAVAADVGGTLILLFVQALLAGPVCGAWAAAAAAWRNTRRLPSSRARRLR